MYTTNDTRTLVPPQAAPIDRTPAGEAAFASEAGVEASGLLTKLIGGFLD